ncbi:DUF501 domain-containing protein [Agrococcus sp. ARC_14]|uniref:DUF501 domain-containing protein n=1 Tax=Agrococcus sp. ARC_14 TaxID=2919927 RepID=UPI001F054292|nr:DUF501 domain-containing protein [Agrococcus sp. ARC_14]MCH1882389.1 DUF501 domain-containing protein [Agrococcus sp. ARC_14]
MALQLGRTMRGVLGIGARCACGAPTVVVTSPRLPDGTPFPTFYYLTHPGATASASRLEADGTMAELQLRLEEPGVADAYAAAHAAYLADREAHGHVEEIAGISAGGMPTRVKCLHAVLAQSLAAGEGVNPIGDLALELGDWSPSVCACPQDQRGSRLGAGDAAGVTRAGEPSES